MNSLVTERLDLGDDEQISKETDQQEIPEQQNQPTSNHELDNWLTSIETSPTNNEFQTLDNEQSEREMVEQPEIIETDSTGGLFDKLVSLTEPELELEPEREQRPEEIPTAEESKFNGLLEQMPHIAEVVNSFESPEVQREVLAALLEAHQKEQRQKEYND